MAARLIRVDSQIWAGAYHSLTKQSEQTGNDSRTSVVARSTCMQTALVANSDSDTTDQATHDPLSKSFQHDKVTSFILHLNLTETAQT